MNISDIEVPKAKLCDGGVEFEIELQNNEFFIVSESGRCGYFSTTEAIDDLLSCEKLNSNRVADVLKK